MSQKILEKEQHLDHNDSSNKNLRDINSKESLNRGLLMVPTNVKGINTFPLNHKRQGSTGTTGDESCTTDEDEGDIDEPDFSDHKHFGSFSGISTITNGMMHHHHHRNSSDISVYSGVDKCSDVSVDTNNEFGEIEGDCECDTVDWSKASSVRNMNNFTFTQLKVGLRQAHQQLKARKEEIHKLTRIKQEVEDELEDLTANLFQEAHNMVREANEKQASAERALRESEMKVEMLMAEVTALKTLVITSTPSSPNPHLHPQIDKNKEEAAAGNLTKRHYRSPSHSHFSYGRSDVPPSPTKTANAEYENSTEHDLEVDPTFYEEFVAWKETPIFDKSSAFISRIYDEDVNLCLKFANSDLSEKIMDAVENGTIFIEALGEKSKNFERNCTLLSVPRICSHRMNLGNENGDWYNISQICRNRITAVCDFLNYLKYIERGLVKSSAQDMFHEVMRLRRNMVLGRMGFPTDS